MLGSFGSAPPASVIAWRAAATSVVDVPRGTSVRVSSRSVAPSAPAIESIVIAETIWSDSGQVRAKWSAPWEPVVPPSVETSTTPRRSFSGASARPISISIAEPTAG